METAIGYPPTYYTVFTKKPSPSSPLAPSSCRQIGCYSDIRDAVQAIVTAFKRDPSGEFVISSTTNKPKYWLHPTKYKDDQM
jgi:hypothetical protein